MRVVRRLKADLGPIIRTSQVLEFSEHNGNDDEPDDDEGAVRNGAFGKCFQCSEAKAGIDDVCKPANAAGGDPAGKGQLGEANAVKQAPLSAEPL